jgi:hypothetical protein
MNRRQMLGTVSTGFAALGVSGRVLAADKEEKSRNDEHSPHAAAMQKCLDACTDCMNECNMTTHYCYEKTKHGTAKYLDALHLAVDCQEFCSQSAKMIGRVSPLMSIACHACADACEKCAAECETHPSDEALTKCGKECRSCAASCHAMVSHAAHHAASTETKSPAR